MNDGESNFEKLKKKLLAAVSARGCTAITVTGYRYCCNSIFRDMKNAGAPKYTKEGGNKYLNSYLEANGENQYYRNLRTVVSRLNDIVSDAWEERHHYKNVSFDISDYQRKLVEEYVKACQLEGKADGTIRLKKYDTELFFSKLNESGCTVIEDISAEYVSKACIRIKDHNIWAEIRMFLRYLSNNGILPNDYSPIVPPSGEEISMELLTQRNNRTVNGYLAVFRNYLNSMGVKNEALIRTYQEGIKKGYDSDHNLRYRANEGLPIQSIEVPRYISPNEFSTILNIIRRKYSLQEECMNVLYA